MRLIDADALKTPIEDRIDNIPASEYDNGWNNAIYAVIDEIDNAPTVEEKSYAMGYQDGAEDGLQGIRTEGKWIYYRAQGVFLPYMECDNCHEEFLLNMLRPAEFRKVNRFCSNCGADMRGNK